MDKSSFKYYCSICKKEYAITPDIMLCPDCKEDNMEGRPLKGVLKVKLPKSDKNKSLDNYDMFDYLPVEQQYFADIPVGNTMLYSSANINKDTGYKNIYFKYEAGNPSGSLKDRASYLVSAFAKKFNIKNITLASTGNAASSMACIAASADQKAIVFVPASAPKAKLIQCLQYGAELIPVDADYDTAFDLSLHYSQVTGCLCRNTGYNPLTIEGKKTVAFEIAAQIKSDIDYVFVPVGDGVILSGVIKGFSDLYDAGLISKFPYVIAVQAEGSSFIHNAFKYGNYNLAYKANTIADSISVNAARNAYCAVNDLKDIGGNTVTVSDEQILLAQKYLSEKSGLFCEPSSAAAMAGFFNIKNKIGLDKTIVILLTGSGLKDIISAGKAIIFPKIYKPNLEFILSDKRI